MLAIEPLEWRRGRRVLRLQAPQDPVLRRMVAQVRIGQEIADRAFDDFPIGPLATVEDRNLSFQDKQQFLDIGVVLAQAPKHVRHRRPSQAFRALYDRRAETHLVKDRKEIAG